MGDNDMPPFETDEAFVAERAQHSRHVAARGHQFARQSEHIDIHLLVATGAQGADAHEIEKAAEHRLRIARPESGVKDLYRATYRVEITQMKCRMRKQFITNVVLADDHKLRVVCVGHKRIKIVWRATKQTLGTQHTRRRNNLFEAVGAVVGTLQTPHAAGDDKHYTVSGSMTAYDVRALTDGTKIESDFAGYLHEVVGTHALKQGESGETLIDIHKSLVFIGRWSP